jgi:hypothetical protein
MEMLKEHHPKTVLALKSRRFTDLDLRNTLLLDNLSTFNLCCNKTFAFKIFKAENALSMLSNGSGLTITKKCKIPGYKYLFWYSKKAITNIICLKNLVKCYRVTYDNKLDKTFVVHCSAFGLPYLFFEIHPHIAAVILGAKSCHLPLSTCPSISCSRQSSSHSRCPLHPQSHLFLPSFLWLIVVWWMVIDAVIASLILIVIIIPFQPPCLPKQRRIKTCKCSVIVVVTTSSMSIGKMSPCLSPPGGCSLLLQSVVVTPCHQHRLQSVCPHFFLIVVLRRCCGCLVVVPAGNKH